MRRRGFTLVELLAVIAIIGILAALLFPVFARARKSAQNTTCISNLKQIGLGMSLYMGDEDDNFPHAVDASDKFEPEIWSDFPEFQARIPQMPLMQDALQPYIKSKAIFQCPLDSGSKMLDNHFNVEFITAPSMHRVYGSSYFFRTEIAFKNFTSTQFELPSDVNVMFDAAGHWHGDAGRLEPNDNFQTYVGKLSKYRYNCLFGDMHVKSLSFDQLQKAWDTKL